MASGFATIENDGYYRTPTCIVKIEDGNGTVLYNSGQNPVLIYKKNAARMMTDVLKGVITNGTGKGLDLGDMPCAGKTGTTNDQKDGWFVGYTRYYTTSVWVGYDMPKKLQGLMGNTYPGKIWQSFMSKAHEGLEPLEFLPYARISVICSSSRRAGADSLKIIRRRKRRKKRHRLERYRMRRHQSKKHRLTLKIKI